MDHPIDAKSRRLFLLGVPIDVVKVDDIASLAQEFAEQSNHNAVVFLSYAKFMRARRDHEYMAHLNRAALVVPVSKSLELACRFLKLPELTRHYPFDFTIRVLGALEEKRRTFYLLGDRHSAVQSIAQNMRTSFPRLVLVGRHSGHYSREKEHAILQAIYKASPTILLLGPGVPGREKWAFRQGTGLPAKISFHSHETFQIMGGKKKRPSRSSFRRGTHEISKALLRPWRLLRIFSYLGFGFLLLLERYKKKH